MTWPFSLGPTALAIALVAGLAAMAAAPDPDKKVTICHKENNNGGKTITVSVNALSAHQAHGDTVGACPVSPSQ